jgi:hypothetical protein
MEESVNILSNDLFVKKNKILNPTRKERIFMEKTREQKREEVLKRLESTLKRKRESAARMEKFLREEYKKQYGVEPKYVNVL